MSGRRAVSALVVGSRVVIAARSHPWHGHTGVIAEPYGKHGLDWIVKLDSGQGCMVSRRDIRPEAPADVEAS